MAKIEVNNVSKVYTQTVESESIVAIERLNFTVRAEEKVAIIGETGCGKSTFFDCLTGVTQESEGEIIVDGRNPSDEFMSFRGEIAQIFQAPRLLPWRTALDNAKMGLEILGSSENDQEATASQWLQRLGLSGYETAYPNELSGGMRQRVNIARAFCIEPEILLLDEAFGGLDEVTATRLRKDFLKLVDEENMTYLMVTHSIREALELGDRILVFDNPAKVIADVPVPQDMSADEKEELHDQLYKYVTGDEDAVPPR